MEVLRQRRGRSIVRRAWKRSSDWLRGKSTLQDVFTRVLILLSCNDMVNECGSGSYAGLINCECVWRNIGLRVMYE